MDPCNRCHEQPSPAYLDGLCPDCFRRVHVEEKLIARRQALASVSQYEREISAAITKLNGPIPANTYQSIMHTCTCGFASLSWIDVNEHIAGARSDELHQHAERGTHLRTPKVRASREPALARSANEENAV